LIDGRKDAAALGDYIVRPELLLVKILHCASIAAFQDDSLVSGMDGPLPVFRNRVFPARIDVASKIFAADKI